MTCAIPVTCRIDGTRKTLFFAATIKHGSLALGPVYGCKSSCLSCAICRREVIRRLYS